MAAYRPFMKSASRHTMAIKALDPKDWLAFGADRESQMLARRQLIDEQPDDVLASLPGSEAGQAELLALLLDYLENHASDLYRFEAGAAVDLTSGLRLSIDDRPPLEVVGRLVQEDFCLLEKRDGVYVLTSAVLCFPAHWLLSEKIGRPLIDIHEPVPGFAEQLGNPVERLFEKLDPEKPVQRLNWSLVDTDKLFLPPSHRKERADIPADRIADRLHLRVERQTLRRLPASRAIAFGIRTYVTPLGQAIETAEAAGALIQRLHELPDPMRAYKNLEDVKPELITFLERRRSTMLRV
ncbi:MAG: DUF3445 domain-containing protein [Pseudomonadota bacterium]